MTDNTTDTRTGPAVQNLVDKIQEDMAEASAYLTRGCAMVRALESVTKGVNGLASVLKAQTQTLESVIRKLEEESEDVAKKMLGGNRPEIVQTVNVDKLAEVRAAKGVAS